MVTYDASPADAKMQRIKCIILPENWPKSVGGGASASAARSILHIPSPAEQQQKERDDAARSKREAESLQQQAEEHERKHRAEHLVKSLRQRIASREQHALQFQSDFNELLKLNEALAFTLLFPLVGGGHLTAIQSLLSRNPDRCCDELDADGRNTLHEAAAKNSCGVAKALHQGSKQKVKFFNLKVKHSATLFLAPVVVIRVHSN
jgi:hypothetical protein